MGMDGRVRRVDGPDVRLGPDDPRTELVVRFDAACGFDFTDIQHLIDPDPTLRDMLTVWFTDEETETSDRISLAVRSDHSR